MSKRDKFKQSDRTQQALDQEETDAITAIDKAIYDGDTGGVDWNKITKQAQSRAIQANNGNIVIGGFTLTQKGAVWDEANKPTKENWEQALSITFRMESGLQWIIGDLVAFGETVGYGDTESVAQLFGKRTQTLYNYGSICRTFPEISRRREILSFGHHDAVAGIKNEKKREQLLDQAIEENWSVARLRQETDDAKNKDDKNSLKQVIKIQRKRISTISNFITRAKSGELDTVDREKALDEIASARRWLDEAEGEIKSST